MASTADFIKSLIVEAIDDGMPPPNAPATIAKKGFDHPLIETGEMRDSIETRTEDTANGITIHVGFYDEENAKKALFNNYGVPGHIPARPFISDTIDKNLDAIAEMASKELVDKILGGRG